MIDLPIPEGEGFATYHDFPMMLTNEALQDFVSREFSSSLTPDQLLDAQIEKIQRLPV